MTDVYGCPAGCPWTTTTPELLPGPDGDERRDQAISVLLDRHMLDAHGVQPGTIGEAWADALQRIADEQLDGA